MTCDLKMTLAVAAEKSIAPLAKKVAELEKQLAVLVKRAASEKDDLTTAEETLAQLKSAAGMYLTESPGAFDRFKTNLKRTTGRVETLRESIQIFDRELVPAKEVELVEARKKLTDAFAALVVAARSDSENRLTELLAAVVAEHDEFMGAIRELGKTYSTAYHGEPPKIFSPRLDEVLHRMSGARWLTFKAAPAVAAPAAPVEATMTPAEKADTPATMPAVPVLARPACVESPPTGAREESVTADGPLPSDKAFTSTCAAAESPTGAAPDTPAPEVDAWPPSPPIPDTMTDAEWEARFGDVGAAEAPPVAGEKEFPKIVAEGT